MGGIKNKLSNKVKNLFNSLPLVGRADEMTKSSQSREGNRTKGSRLPSFSQPSKMPDGQISNTRKLSHWGLYASKTIGSLRPTSQSLPLAKGRQMSYAHRWGRITKYLGVACLSFTILSTLVLNIISSYSNSNTRSNAEPLSNSSASTLANNNDSSICDPNNTNAESCISLSITSSSSSTGSNDPNLSLSIPQGGGIATGRHAVSVDSNTVNGYSVTLNSNNPTTTNLTSNESGSVINSLHEINNFLNPTTLLDNTWGVAINPQLPPTSDFDIRTPEAVPCEASSKYTDCSLYFIGNYDTDNQEELAAATFSAIPAYGETYANVIAYATSGKSISRPIYYGVRVDHPDQLQAGNYTTTVAYTATAYSVPVPVLKSVTPSNYELSSNSGLDGNDRLPVTVKGTNLKSTYNVYLESNTE